MKTSFNYPELSYQVTEQANALGEYHDLWLLFIAFGLTTLVGGLLSYYYQRRHWKRQSEFQKKEWDRQNQIELNQRLIDQAVEVAQKINDNLVKMHISVNHLSAGVNIENSLENFKSSFIELVDKGILYRIYLQLYLDEKSIKLYESFIPIIKRFGEYIAVDGLRKKPDTDDFQKIIFDFQVATVKFAGHTARIIKSIMSGESMNYDNQ